MRLILMCSVVAVQLVRFGIEENACARNDSSTTIHGKVYLDFNRNSQRDSGEAGLGGWKIYLTGPIDTSVFSDSAGDYLVSGLPAGTYLVSESLRVQWMQTAPKTGSSPSFQNPANLLIYPEHERGIFRSLCVLAKEAYAYFVGAGGHSYEGYSISPSDSVLGSAYPWSILEISLQTENQINAQAISKFVVAGMISAVIDSFGRVGSVVINDPLRVGTWISSDTDQTKDFGNSPLEIYGRVLLSARDSVIGLAGRKVHVSGPIDTVLTTDSNGDYSLQDFPWGTYTIVEDQSPGWFQTVPPQSTQWTTYRGVDSMWAPLDSIGENFLGAYGTMLLLLDTAYQDYYHYPLDGYHFGYEGFFIDPYGLGGMNDPFATYTVTLVSATSLSLNAVSKLPFYNGTGMGETINATGDITPLMLFGDFYIYQSHASQKYVRPFLRILDNGYQTYRANFPDGYVFRNVPSGELHGIVFHDANRNGVRDQSEKGLRNTRVYIGGPVIDSMSTDTSGNYSFANLPPGTYVVNEKLDLGMSISHPDSFAVLASRDSLIWNLDHIFKHLHGFASEAYNYYLTPSTMFGGNGCYNASDGSRYLVPLELKYDTSGFYEDSVVSCKEIEFVGHSSFDFGAVSVKVDSLGRLHDISIQGRFAKLGSWIVMTDSLHRRVNSLNFGNYTALDTVTSVRSARDVPHSFALYQNYPNPFNPTTDFEFRIANFGFVSLKVYDELGREVATLVNEVKQPGEYSVRWDASNMPSGIYFYRMTAGPFGQAKKLLLLK
ncbi:MAG: SdrD B-like domain-containing protein [Bacteroidota bacterium]